MNCAFYSVSRKLIHEISMLGTTEGPFMLLIINLCYWNDLLVSFCLLWINITFRFVGALMNRSDEDELNYTEEMIGENFSNYSAWHNRRYGHQYYSFDGDISILLAALFL